MSQFSPATFFLVLVASEDLDFQHHTSRLFVMFNELRREAIVRFVKIGGTVDHHSLNFLFT